MIKKRLAALALALLLVLSCACEKNTPPVEPTAEPFRPQIALITGTEEIEVDFDLNAVWEGIVNCGETNNIPVKSFRPAADTTEEYQRQIEQAIMTGCSVIICQGDRFGAALLAEAKKHPEDRFIGLDISVDGELPANVHTVWFRQEQAGYLAGYGAVMDGFRSLAALMAENTPVYKSYAFGFIQGAGDAAKILETPIEIRSAYASMWGTRPEILDRLGLWYDDGVELVMLSLNDTALSESCANVAVQKMGYLVGINNDQSYLAAYQEYNPFMTSAVKGLREVTDATLDRMIATDDWQNAMAGKTAYYGLENGNYLYLPDNEALWLFQGFTLEHYEEVKEKISDGTITVKTTDQDLVDENWVSWEKASVPIIEPTATPEATEEPGPTDAPTAAPTATTAPTATPEEQP